MNEIVNNGSWNALPMSENVTMLVYGITYEGEDGKISVGPYLTDDNGDAIIPEIENGYYYFCDRHSESTDSTDDSEVLNRSSFNFTVALYDKDTNYLYYAELDT